MSRNKTFVWGYNNATYNFLGLFKKGTGNEPKPILCEALSDLRTIKAVTGYYNTFVLCDDGRVWSWGNSQNNGSEIVDNSMQVPLPVLLPDIVDLVAGNSFAAALSKFGDLYYWGSLFDSKLEVRPKKISVKNIMSISSNDNELFFVTEDSKLYCLPGTEGEEPRLIMSNVLKAYTGGGTHQGIAKLVDGSFVYWKGNTTEPLPRKVLDAHASRIITISMSNEVFIALRGGEILRTNFPDLDANRETFTNHVVPSVEWKQLASAKSGCLALTTSGKVFGVGESSDHSLTESFKGGIHNISAAYKELANETITSVSLSFTQAYAFYSNNRRWPREMDRNYKADITIVYK